MADKRWKAGHGRHYKADHVLDDAGGAGLVSGGREGKIMKRVVEVLTSVRSRS